MEKRYVKQVQRSAMKVIRGLGHFLYEDKQRDVGGFSLEKNRLQVEPIAACQHLWGSMRLEGEGLFIRECSDRMKSNSFKLKEGRFR